MEEFPDELIAKYTRKELEAMAIDLEITTVGLSTKAQLAEAIFETKRKMEETEAEPAEKAAEAVPAEMAAEAEPSEKAAEAVPAEKVTKVTLQVGGKGVLAKMAAVENESRSMHDKALAIQKAGQNMRREGAEQMRARVSEMERGIEEQVKENQRSIKNFDRGVREILTDIDKESRLMREKASAIHKAGQDMRQEGFEEMRARVSEMRKGIEEQVKENQRSIKNFDRGVGEILTDIDKESRLMREKASAIQKAGQDIRQDGLNRMRKNVGDFTAEINEFVKVDLENYVRDFYYG
jgi:soluble cytochrome b562